MDDEEALAEDQRVLEVLGSALHYHNLAPMVLSSGGTKLVDKFEAIMYGMFLESGDSLTNFSSMCRSIVSGTFDLGTEFCLPNIHNVPAQTLFPWAHPDVERTSMPEGGDDDVAALELAHEPPALVGLFDSLQVPGLLHIIHNAGNDLLESVDVLDEAITKMAQVARLIADEQSCERLIETCFQGGVAAHFHKQFQKFHSKVYRPRWGTVAFCVREILPLRRPLEGHRGQWGWDLKKYKRGTAKHRAVTDEPGKTSISLDVVDECITSVFWWSCLETLDHLFNLLRDGFLGQSHVADTANSISQMLIPSSGSAGKDALSGGCGSRSWLQENSSRCLLSST